MRSRFAENRIKANNAGFSLVELLVTILLISIVSGIVVAFISSSLRTYDIVDTQAQLQEESEFTTDFIRNLAVEASRAGYLGSDELIGSSISGSEVLWFYGPDPNNTSNRLYHLIIYDPDSNTLRYVTVNEGLVIAAGNTLNAETTIDATTVVKMIGDSLDDDVAPYHLLAKHVYPDSTDNKVISYDHKDASKESSLLTFTINFRYRNSEDYPAELKVVARNLIPE